MAQQESRSKSKRPIESYEHRDKERLNNPPAGLVTPETDPDAGQKKKTYAYDPHLDPQLVWAGKAEHTSFEAPTVSLHVHERIDPRTIIETVRKLPSPTGRGWREAPGEGFQLPLFEVERKEPLRQPVEFYRHAHGWSNRLIAGDSLLVMNSLLEKEGMAGKVQMIYIDPPYGIKYGSNFQPFVNKRDVKDGKDEDLTAEPEQIRAFRDTWELGIHSYLTYLRDRLLLARELLTESGSIFVQISDENVHHVRELMDEVFGAGNFVIEITFLKTSGQTTKFLPPANDYLLWYANDIGKTKYHELFKPRTQAYVDTEYNYMETQAGKILKLSQSQLQNEDWSSKGKRFRIDNLTSQSGPGDTPDNRFTWNGKTYRLKSGSWKTSIEGLKILAKANRLWFLESTLYYKRYLDDFPIQPINNIWDDTTISGYSSEKIYVVQTLQKVIERCILMTTDPGDLVFDPTCGSGTTAYVAEKWGRRWITCDTSRVALAIARQRLMTAVFDYYELAHPEEGVGSGFKYKTVPHVTLKSIANNPEIDGIHARWQERLEPIRARLNALLVPSPQPSPKGRGSEENPLPPGEGGRRPGEGEPSGEGGRRPGEGFPGEGFEEWQIPREPAADWPEEAKRLLAEWWDLRRKRQADIDAAIAGHAPQETLYDQPLVDRNKVRVTGPFTVEAVPSPAVKSVDELLSSPPAPLPEGEGRMADASIARSGETLRQAEWRDELLRAGIRGKAGQHIRFARLEPLPGCRYLHADGETRPSDEGADSVREDAPAYNPMRVVVSFGPEHAPLEQRQVAQAIEEAQTLVPKPKLIVFAAFQFDPEAARDIDETNWPGVTLLKAQMNADLLTDDLKKKRASNESFWLIGQPDVEVRKQNDGKYLVEVHGFDYYNTKSGQIESGGSDKIAVWLLDTDYDGRSLYPRQVFFPMAGENEGWAKLAKNLKAEIDEERIEAYRGAVSLPFEAGEHKRIAVKIVDDRGIESLKVLEV